jgi:hypothetical protein
LPTPLQKKSDVKIFILFLLRQLGRPLDYTTLNDVVVQDGVVGCFDFAECFAELLETGNIAEYRMQDGNKYAITEQGWHVADHLQSELLPQIREKSLQSALRLLSFQARGAKLFCTLEPSEGGGCCLTCGITEAKGELFRVSLQVETRQQAEKMKLQFQEKPEMLYRGILALLNGEMSYLLD